MQIQKCPHLTLRSWRLVGLPRILRLVGKPGQRQLLDPCTGPLLSHSVSILRQVAQPGFEDVSSGANLVSLLCARLTQTTDSA